MFFRDKRDQESWIREKDIDSLKQNEYLQDGDIVQLIDNNFYEIISEETDIPLLNNLYAKVLPSNTAIDASKITSGTIDISRLPAEIIAKKDIDTEINENSTHEKIPSSQAVKEYIENNCDISVATTEVAGKVKPDGTSILVTEDGTISVANKKLNLPIEIKDEEKDIITLRKNSDEYLLQTDKRFNIIGNGGIDNMALGDCNFSSTHKMKITGTNTEISAMGITTIEGNNVDIIAGSSGNTSLKFSYVGIESVIPNLNHSSKDLITAVNESLTNTNNKLDKGDNLSEEYNTATKIEAKIKEVNESLKNIDLSQAEVLSATKLKTPRTINGVAFDGTANITIKAEANGGTASTAGNCTGNSATATKLSTARKIGSASFDGTADITVSQIGAAASTHAHSDLMPINGNSTKTGNLTITGELYCNNNVTAYSDEITKRNMTPLNDEVLNKLQKIQFYNYEMINDPEKRTRVGVKARELEKLFPELVFEDSNGIKRVDYIGLNTYFSFAMQKLLQKLLGDINVTR